MHASLRKKSPEALHPPLYTYIHEMRTRYAETDQMGYVYHGKFLEYFEVARTEMIRDLGFSYKDLEALGVMLPVMNVELNYKRPVFYDELMRIQVSIYDRPDTRLFVYYDVLSPEGKTKVEGRVVLCFVDQQTRRPCAPPELFRQRMNAAIDAAAAG
ncbi:MAG: acyl-CoA thioesterase [Cyclonatronaceae bacterium]